MEVPVLEELLLLHFCLFPAQCRNEHRLSAVLGHSLYFCQWDTRVALFSDGHEVWGAAKTLRPSPPLYEWPTWDLRPTLRPLCSRLIKEDFLSKIILFTPVLKEKETKIQTNIDIIDIIAMFHGILYCAPSVCQEVYIVQMILMIITIIFRFSAVEIVMVVIVSCLTALVRLWSYF